MQLIDSHCHLEEIENLAAAIRRAKKAGVMAIVAVGADYQSNIKVLQIAKQYKGFVYPALGIHPSNIEATKIDQTLHFIEEHIGEVRAIGEVGLDYHKRVIQQAPRELQQTVFRAVLALAKKYRKPVIVHSRYAWKDALDLVEEAGVEKAVFHWFTGPSSVTTDIVRLNYFVSATPAAEYHAEHRRASKAVPLENLLLETDSPVSYGRETRWQAEPSDIVRALKAAAARGISEAELARITAENAVKFFKLPAR